MIEAQLPALQVVVPLLGAVICAMTRNGWVAWAIALLVSWAMPVIAVLMLLQVLDSGTISYAMGGWEPPWGIEYRVDAINAFVIMLVSAIGAIILPYARQSVASEIDEDKHSWFYTMYLLCLAGLLGMAITGDAFNIFVFMEVSSLATYVLIALGDDRRALLAAYQYLILGTIGATLYVIGVGILYNNTGTLNLHDMAGRIGDVEHTGAILAALAFLTVGISLKLALFPLHVWLPNAYAYAPSFATAFLAATATKGGCLSAAPILFLGLCRCRHFQRFADVGNSLGIVHCGHVRRLDRLPSSKRISSACWPILRWRRLAISRSVLRLPTKRG